MTTLSDQFWRRSAASTDTLAAPPTQEIACEKAARKLLLMVSSDDGLLSAGVSRKVTLEVGSMAEMTSALQSKLNIGEPLQVFLVEGAAAQPCTSLDQVTRSFGRLSQLPVSTRVLWSRVGQAHRCTNRAQLPDKAKVLVRAIRVTAPPVAASSNDGKRNFKLLVTSPV